VKCGARVALGVAGGYFLGRTKKMKLALMLAGMAAGRQVGGPGELLGAGTKLLGSSPDLSRLVDEVRDRLLASGKNAALAVATRQVESLTDRVGKRVESLGDIGAPRRRVAEEPGPEEDTADAADEAVDDEDAVDEEPADEAPAPVRRASRSPASKTPVARGGKSATATARRGAGGVTRAAGRPAPAHKPGRTTRPRRGDGDG
jgi:hypothetical protein